MSNPSRFDFDPNIPGKGELLSGNGGYYFNKDCLRPQANIYQCDVRLIDDPAPLLPETKVILLMGEKAHRLYTGQNTTLDEGRGSPNIVNGIPCISTFTAQDMMDFKDYESKKNPLHQSVEEFLSEEIAAGEIVASKGRGKTTRKNYKFWVAQDTKKALRILENNGKIPSPTIPQPEYVIRPNSKELVDILSTTKNDTLHIDIETDFLTLDIRCISFAFESKPDRVYIFPVLDTNYKPAYDNLPLIIRSLAVAFRDNTTVAHNGALFDFFVFGYKYHIPMGRKLYDTMIAGHRIYPEIEKSLGHWMSLVTYEPYHKNEGNHSYRTASQAEQLMYYCGKDVYGMMLVKKAQEEIASKDPGLQEAIAWSNRAIRPYLMQSFLGQKYNEDKRQAWIRKNDRIMTQYLRYMKILTGTDDPFPLISNKKCCEYFHDEMGYKVVDRGSKGEPSLKAGALIKLKQQYPENIVIEFLLRYRELKKESGTLMFRPWIKRAGDSTNYLDMELVDDGDTD